jgi:hypothetical protein
MIKLKNLPNTHHFTLKTRQKTFVIAKQHHAGARALHDIPNHEKYLAQLILYPIAGWTTFITGVDFKLSNT